MDGSRPGWLLALLRTGHPDAPRAEEPPLQAADFAARLEQHLDRIDTQERRRTLMRGLLKAASHLRLEGDEQDS